jgi:hypothetical protein
LIYNSIKLLAIIQMKRVLSNTTNVTNPQVNKMKGQTVKFNILKDYIWCTAERTYFNIEVMILKPLKFEYQVL